MRYLVRTLMMLVFIPGAAILVLGFTLSFILSLLQYPFWFILKGELLKDEDTLIVWYLACVVCWAEDLWERILKWSKE